MNALQPLEVAPPVATSDQRFRRDTIGVTMASLVGQLTLLVSACTAYIQRQQVRAQVWPCLTRAWADPVGRPDQYLLLLDPGRLADACRSSASWRA